MSDTGAVDIPTTGEDETPQLRVLAQYIKDLSFEAPGAPRALLAQAAEQPRLDIEVDVQAGQLSPTDYEVVFSMKIRALRLDETIFHVEMDMAGLLRLIGIPEDSIQPVLFIEGPRLLFPFARRLIADLVRESGFPPLMIDPIDFVALYHSRQSNSGEQVGHA